MPRGWVQAYNAQAVNNAGQIVIAADVSTDAQCRQLGPEGDRRMPGTKRPRESGKHAHGLFDDRSARRPGIQTLVASDADRREEPAARAPRRPYDSPDASWSTERGQRSTPAARRSRARLRPGQAQPRRRLLRRRGRSAVRSAWAAAGGHPLPPRAPPTPTRHRLTRRRPQRLAPDTPTSTAPLRPQTSDNLSATAHATEHSAGATRVRAHGQRLAATEGRECDTFGWWARTPADVSKRSAARCGRIVCG
jgi:hypothetical protein